MNLRRRRSLRDTSSARKRRRPDPLVQAREVLHIEAEAIRALRPRINATFARAVALVAGCRGRVVVTGMGKAGLIGQKLSATFASTGTPSLWLHAAEAIHGDVGRVTAQDLVIALSNSGETEEVTRLLPTIRKLGARLIALTGRPRSTLATHSDVVLDVSIKEEACHMGLAPTASTTAMLALGDALAVAASAAKGFSPRQFALLHPGGQLGKRLLLTVRDVMRTGSAHPVARASARVSTVLLAITRARAGCASIVDDRGILCGIFTDGDLRRHLETTPDLPHRAVREVMTHRPKTIAPERLAVEALRLLEQHRIDELPVVDRRQRPIGLVDVQDVLRAGLV